MLQMKETKSIRRTQQFSIRAQTTKIVTYFVYLRNSLMIYGDEVIEKKFNRN